MPNRTTTERRVRDGGLATKVSPKRGPVIQVPTPKDLIDERHRRSPNAFGEPRGALHRVGTAWVQEYEGGVIAVRGGSVVATYGAICARWRELGGASSILGLPRTDELDTDDGRGRWNAFDGGDIYWRADLGAHEVYGAIRAHWLDMGGVTSKAGYPRTGELPCEVSVDAERVSHFEHGSIFWGSKKGTRFAPPGIRVSFTGFTCRDESSESSDSDEPYLTVGCVVPGTSYKTEYRTGVVGDVDRGEEVPFSFRLYEGEPRDIVVTGVMMEHDHGDPHALGDEFSQALSTAVAAGLAAVSKGAGAALKPVLDKLLGELGNVLSELIGADDDTVGAFKQEFCLYQLIDWAMSPDRRTSGGIRYDRGIRVGNDDEGEYTLWFRVEAA